MTIKKPVINDDDSDKLSVWICSICSEPEQHPVMIVKCGHSFCEECLLKLESCPQCRCKYDKYDLQTNFALLSPDTKQRFSILSTDEKIDQLLAKREGLINLRIDKMISNLLDLALEKIKADPMIGTIAIPFLGDITRDILVQVKKKLETKGLKIIITEYMSPEHILDSYIITLQFPKREEEEEDIYSVYWSR